MELEKEMMIPDWTSERRKGKLVEIDYIRTFLGHEMIFVPIYQVLLFFISPDISWGNPFMKSIMKSIAYNGTKIIAYDNCPFQKSKSEYAKLLKQAGYEEIYDIAMPIELGCKTGSLKFYDTMIHKYNPEQKLCGMVGRHMNVYAKLKHMYFLVYSSPDIYPRRNVYDKETQTDTIIENFINFQLFDGLRTETIGYHFGYSFAGILLYYWAIYIKKKAVGKPVYFLWNARHVYEVYKKMFPNDQAQVVYLDEETRDDLERTAYLKALKPGYFVNGDIKKRAKFGHEYHVIELIRLFSKEALEQHGEAIELMLDEITGHSVYIAKIKDGLPHWRKHHFVEEDSIKRREMKKGYLAFVKEFHGFAKKHPRINRELLEDKGIFVANTMGYAYDEKRRKKIYYDVVQFLTETKKAKKCIRYMRKFYGKVRKK